MKNEKKENNKDREATSKTNKATNTSKINKTTNKKQEKGQIKNKTNKKADKQKKKQAKKEKLVRLSLILILLIAIICIGVYIARLNTDYIENYNFYQYIGGRKIFYEGALKITKKGEITELSTIDIDIELDSTPLYYQDEENKVLFPENMELVIPNDNGQVYKIIRFSNIKLESDIAYIQYREKTRELPEGFIFDGSNLYFFLTDATLTVNNETYELSPLSYVVAYSQSSVEIYNKETDEYQIIETSDYATVETSSYSINLSLDTIKYGDKEQLLLKKFDEIQTFSLEQ